MKSFKTIQLGDEKIQRFQDNVKAAVDPLLQLPISDGVLLKGIALKAGTENKVSHKLSREPQLWFVADKNAAANIWRVSWDGSLLTLKASADCTVSLWVA